MNRAVRRTSSLRRGFTRIEFLFLLGIVFVVGIFSVPVFLVQREHARKLQCLQNMRGVAQAFLDSAETRGGKLTPLSAIRSSPDASGQRSIMGWPAILLSQNPTKLIDPLVDSKRFVCPTDIVASDTPGRISFVMNTGFISRDLYNGDPDRQHVPGSLSWGGVPRDANAIAVHAATGVIWPESDVFESSLGYVSEGDGTTLTLLITENLQAGSWSDTDTAKIGFGFPVANTAGVVPVGPSEFFCSPPEPLNTWCWGLPITALPQDWMVNVRLNAKSGTLPRPSSKHRGGVNAIHCDGSGRFLNDAADLYFYYKMLTPNGVTFGERHQ